MARDADQTGVPPPSGSPEPSGTPSPDPVATPYAPPVKRSVTIAGHQTAISLEPLFWEALRRAAAARALPINALIARIDVERMAAPDPPNLTSAIRCWLYALELTTFRDNVRNVSQ